MILVTLEPVTNRQTWTDQCEVRDEDDVLIDLSAATIVLGVRDKNTKDAVLTAKTADGTITIQTTGVFEFSFTETQMRTVCASKAYEVGCTIELNGATMQFFIGTISVLDGITP